MKLIYCTFNVTIQETLLKKLTAEGVKSYQLFEGVKVKPAIGNPRLDTAVWPGYNKKSSREIQSPYSDLFKNV
jgi:hypothetical protein